MSHLARHHHAEMVHLIRHYFNAQNICEFRFEGFSPSIDLTSLYVNGGTSKAIIILEIPYRTHYVGPTSKED